MLNTSTKPCVTVECTQVLKHPLLRRNGKNTTFKWQDTHVIPTTEDQFLNNNILYRAVKYEDASFYPALQPRYTYVLFECGDELGVIVPQRTLQTLT